MMKSEKKHVCLAQQNGFGLAFFTQCVLSADKRHSIMEYSKKSHIPDFFDSGNGPNWPKMSKTF
jgi:hypothetical protein